MDPELREALAKNIALQREVEAKKKATQVAAAVRKASRVAKEAKEKKTT